MLNIGWWVRPSDVVGGGAAPLIPDPASAIGGDTLRFWLFDIAALVWGCPGYVGSTLVAAVAPVSSLSSSSSLLSACIFAMDAFSLSSLGFTRPPEVELPLLPLPPSSLALSNAFTVLFLRLDAMYPSLPLPLLPLLAPPPPDPPLKSEYPKDDISHRVLSFYELTNYKYITNLLLFYFLC
jgi:hypothetical protein